MRPDPVASDLADYRHARPLFLAKVFFVFFLLGCAGLVFVASQAKRDYRVAKAYLGSEAEIIESLPIVSGVHTRPGQKRNPSVRPSFVFRFATQEGETVTTRGYDAYGGREAPPAEWSTLSPGDRVPCWYDPDEPRRAVLSRRFNPHFYWVLAMPLGVMLFTGLLLRECLRRATPPLLKGIEKGRRLAWRLPPVASQRAMAGCLGVALVILVLLTTGFVLAALDYQVEPYQFRWISRVLGFNMNGWWIVALAAAVVAGVFLWAFLANLRWIVVPEPEVEVNATRLLPGESTRLLLRQTGPLKAETFTVSLICEINGTPGKPPAIRKSLIERNRVETGESRRLESFELDAELSIPADARATCKSVPVTVSGAKTTPDLVSWFVRVERKVAPKTTLQSDFEILVGP